MGGEKDGLFIILPGTGGETFPAQLLFFPSTLGCQIQRAQSQMGDGLNASLPAASALVKKYGAPGICSHHRTPHSGTSGTESWKEKILYESAADLLHQNCLYYSMHY